MNKKVVSVMICLVILLLATVSSMIFNHQPVFERSKIEISTLSAKLSNSYVVKVPNKNEYYCFKCTPKNGIYKTTDGKNFDFIYETDVVYALAAQDDNLYFAGITGLYQINNKGDLLQSNKTTAHITGLAIKGDKVLLTDDKIYGGKILYVNKNNIKTIENAVHQLSCNIREHFRTSDGDTQYLGNWNNTLFVETQKNNGDTYINLFDEYYAETFLRKPWQDIVICQCEDGIIILRTIEADQKEIYKINKNGKEAKLASFLNKETVPEYNYTVLDNKVIILSQKWKENGPQTYANKMTNNHKCDIVNIIDLETGEHKRGYESKPGERVLFADLNTMLTYYDGKIQCRKLGDLSLIYEEDAAYLKKPGSYSVELAVDRVFIYKNNDLLGNYAVR